MKNKIPYVTTPIYYANAEPHVGHLYTNLIADTWKKISAMKDLPCFYSSGVDEHGQKVEQTAIGKGVTPRDYCDNISQKFLTFFEHYGMVSDKWVRTSSQEHKEAAQHFWSILDNNGFIYKGTYEGWYSVRDETYFAEADLKNGKAPTGADVIWMEEECYYFRLSRFQDDLEDFYQNNPDFILPRKRQNEAVNFIKKGLRDFAISRPKKKLSWGIDVPGDPDHVMYVWIEALVNYLSAVGYPDKGYKKYWPAIHLIGKDILKFHAVYWLALLMGAKIDLPQRIIAHGWWLKDSQKISKSEGNTVDLKTISAKYQTDGVRYFLLKTAKIGEDGQIREDLVKSVVFADLANSYGNLFLRVNGLIEAMLGGEMIDTPPLPDMLVNLVEDIEELKGFIDEVHKKPEEVFTYVNKLSDLIKKCDALITKSEAWKKTRDKAAALIYNFLHISKKIGILSYPIIPEAAKILLDFYKVEPALDSFDKPIMQIMANVERPVVFPKNR